MMKGGKNMSKALVIGAAMLDVVMEIEELPKQGSDTYAKSQQMNVGGCAFNVADILKHFEVEYDLFAPVGNGVYGRIVEEGLSEAGQTSLLKDDEMDNGYCLCLVDNTGERTFITLPGVECNFKKEWFDLIENNHYDYAYISGYEIEGEGGEHIISFLERHKEIEVFYGPGPRINYISNEKHQDLLDKIKPIVHLNEEEALSFTRAKDYQEAARVINKRTNNKVIITLGSRGLYMFDGDEYEVEGVKTKVIDTIGAGDSNIGAIIAMSMKNASWRERLEVANKVSAAVVSVKGPTLKEGEFGGIL